MDKLYNSVSTLSIDKIEVWGVRIFCTIMVLCTGLLEYVFEVLKLRFYTFMFCNFIMIFYKMADFQQTNFQYDRASHSCRGKIISEVARPR